MTISHTSISSVQTCSKINRLLGSLNTGTMARDTTFIQTMPKTLCSVKDPFNIPSQYLTTVHQTEDG